MMKAEMTSKSAKEAGISLTDSDIGMLYIVQHELFKNPGIGFAGVIVKHHLTNEIWMNVTSTGPDPVKQIAAATNTAISTVRDLEKLFGSKIKVK